MTRLPPLLLPTPAAATALALLVAGCQPTETLEPLHEVPPFDLTEAAGEPFERNDLLGRYHLVAFVFTECPLACPVMTTQMKRLYTEFPHEELGFVSISVDPDNDTLEVLREYRDELAVSPERWKFLRGDIETIREVSEEGFLLAAADLPYGHSQRFVLVDPLARIVGFYQSDDPEHLARLREDLARTLS